MAIAPVYNGHGGVLRCLFEDTFGGLAPAGGTEVGAVAASTRWGTPEATPRAARVPLQTAQASHHSVAYRGRGAACLAAAMELGDGMAAAALPATWQPQHRERRERFCRWGWGRAGAGASSSTLRPGPSPCPQEASLSAFRAEREEKLRAAGAAARQKLMGASGSAAAEEVARKRAVSVGLGGSSLPVRSAIQCNIRPV